ncbi:MAG TPA: histidine kinase [Solirubrobacterales bacterium]|nr:histidine kinase [Solirubrobacterales bacterium]
MHPILEDGRRLLAYVAAWELVGILLSLLLGVSGAFAWAEALSLAIPLSALYGFMCLGAYWVCRAAPLHAAGLFRVASTQLAAAALSAAVLLQAAQAWARLLDRTGLFPLPLTRHAGAVAPLLLGMGMTLFLLAAALYYVLAALEASRRAETEALRYQVLSRDAELRALRSQHHPHILFNCLNSISALVGARPAEARRVCELLAELLRRSLAAGERESVTLAEEIALARSYLSVEQVRFGERLAVETRVDPAAEAWLVPSLILQPLVENAVTHGIASRLHGGAVALEAAVRNGRLVLVVENPRDPEAAPRPGTGVGLDNVRRRLDAVYGGEAEMGVKASAAGFRVELLLPSRPGRSND